MGKRTLRTLHFELVATIIRAEREHIERLPDGAYRDGATHALQRVARLFAEIFEERAEGFRRERFLDACGIDSLS